MAKLKSSGDIKWYEDGTDGIKPVIEAITRMDALGNVQTLNSSTAPSDPNDMVRKADLAPEALVTLTTTDQDVAVNDGDLLLFEIDDASGTSGGDTITNSGVDTAYFTTVVLDSGGGTSGPRSFMYTVRTTGNLTLKVSTGTNLVRLTRLFKAS